MISPKVLLAGSFAILTQICADSLKLKMCHGLPNYTTTDHGEPGVMYSNAPSDSRTRHYFPLKGDSIAFAEFAVQGQCPMALRNISFYALRKSICVASYRVHFGSTSFNMAKEYSSNCSKSPCLHSYLSKDFPETLTDQRYDPSTISVTIRSRTGSPCIPLQINETGTTRLVLNIWMQDVHTTPASASGGVTISYPMTSPEQQNTLSTSSPTRSTTGKSSVVQSRPTTPTTPPEHQTTWPTSLPTSKMRDKSTVAESVPTKPTKLWLIGIVAGVVVIFTIMLVFLCLKLRHKGKRHPQGTSDHAANNPRSQTFNNPEYDYVGAPSTHVAMSRTDTNGYDDIELNPGNGGQLDKDGTTYDVLFKRGQDHPQATFGPSLAQHDQVTTGCVNKSTVNAAANNDGDPQDTYDHLCTNIGAAPSFSGSHKQVLNGYDYARAPDTTLLKAASS